MLCLRRVLMVCVLLGGYLPVGAFTFQYGQALTVQGLKQEKGRLVLPVTRKKYRNVKIAARPLYQFLQQCQAVCLYPVDKIEFESTDYRRAFTNENLVIAQVKFNKELIITFLVSRQNGKLTVEGPGEVHFIDTALQQRVYSYLTELVQHEVYLQ